MTKTFNPILSEEKAHAILGVPGRLFARTVRHDEKPGCFCSQKWISEARSINGYGEPAHLRVEMRFDDDCRNGHNTFAITGTVTADQRRNRRDPDLAGGCLHDEIARIFPELAPLIKWHLVATDGPMHYLANAVYLAGDRDHWGLRKGEERQVTTRDGQKRWELVAVTDGPEGLGVKISDTETGRKYTGAETVPLFILSQHATGDQPPATPKLEWRPAVQIGEGKARELDAARRVAVWPEATDEELEQEPDALRAALEARLPALLAAFRADMTAAGFAWSPEDLHG